MKPRFRLLVTGLSPLRFWVQSRPRPYEIIEGQNRTWLCFSPHILVFPINVVKRKLFTLMYPHHMSRNDENKLIFRDLYWNLKLRARMFWHLYIQEHIFRYFVKLRIECGVNIKLRIMQVCQSILIHLSANYTRCYPNIWVIYTARPKRLPYALPPLDVVTSMLCESVCQQLSIWEDVFLSSMRFGDPVIFLQLIWLNKESASNFVPILRNRCKTYRMQQEAFGDNAVT
jgi:hypothetical protein